MLTNHSLPQNGSALPFSQPPNKRAISKWTFIINQNSILWNLGFKILSPPKKTWLEGKHCLKWPLPCHASWIVRNTSIAWSYQYLSTWHAWNVANLGPPEMLNSWLVVNWRLFEDQNRTNSVSFLASSNKRTDRLFLAIGFIPTKNCDQNMKLYNQTWNTALLLCTWP